VGVVLLAASPTGGVAAFDDTVDVKRTARFAFELCAEESSGKCTPCRIGSTRGADTIDKIMAGLGVDADLDRVADLAQTREVRLAVRPGPLHAVIRSPARSSIPPTTSSALFRGCSLSSDQSERRERESRSFPIDYGLLCSCARATARAPVFATQERRWLRKEMR
jgi:hypothetical protein